MKAIAGPSWAKGLWERLITQHKVQPRLLIVVQVVIDRPLRLTVQGLVLEHRIKQGAGGVDALLPLMKESLGKQAQGLRIALEASKGLHEPVQGALPSMPKGRVPKIMGKTGALDQIRINLALQASRQTLGIEPVAETAPNLRHLNAMGQTRAIKIVLTREKHLRLALQAPKGPAVNDPIAVDLKHGAELASGRLSRLTRFDIKGRVEGVGHQRHGPTSTENLRRRNPTCKGRRLFTAKNARPAGLLPARREVTEAHANRGIGGHRAGSLPVAPRGP